MGDNTTLIRAYCNRVSSHLWVVVVVVVEVITTTTTTTTTTTHRWKQICKVSSFKNANVTPPLPPPPPLPTDENNSSVVQPVMVVVVVVCSELTWPEIGRVFCSYRKFNLNTVCHRDDIMIKIVHTRK